MDNKKHLEIGDRKLSSITADEILDVVMIEGCHAHLDFWNKPIILEYNNSMFSDTIVVDYQSTRIEDGVKSDVMTFFFELKWFSYNYHSERLDRSHSKRFSLEAIKYLLSKGFYLPLI